MSEEEGGRESDLSTYQTAAGAEHCTRPEHRLLPQCSPGPQKDRTEILGRM